jgi:hypothetical protein
MGKSLSFMVGSMIISLFLLFFTLACSSKAAAAESWILWQSTPTRAWHIVAGYPTYEDCRKDLSKKDKVYRGLGFLNVDLVGHQWAPKQGGTEMPDLTSVTGFYCLPSNFHPKEGN